MAEVKTQKLEREYVIPLRREFLKMPQYRRGGRAIKTIKKFIAKHMKVPERDTDKVKLDIYLNNEVLFRGRKNPPSKIKVKAVKEGEIVKVSLAETPEHVKFLKLKHSKMHKKAEKVAPKEEKAETKTEAEKEDEKEKEKAVAEQNIKQAEQQAKAQKHLTAPKEPGFHRMALKK